MQLSLLGAAKTQADPSFARARRIQLSAAAWLDWVPGWIGGHERLFDRLRATARWERHGRQMYERYVEVPRLVASCPGAEEGLQLPGEDVLEQTMAQASEAEVSAIRHDLQEMARLLSERYARNLGRISLAYYRDGEDSVAFHGDRLGVLRPDTVVAIASLGAPRKFLLRPRRVRAAEARNTAGANEAQETTAAGDAGQAKGPLRFQCGEGDLIVMGGDCQESWEHGVPKASHAGPRIALMFREANPEVEPGNPHSREDDSAGQVDVEAAYPVRRAATQVLG